jgi:hypothetical protein
VIRELEQFCEDNNRQAPAPMRSVPARDELYFNAGDPSLLDQVPPATEMRVESGRVCYLQRVVWEIRYSLFLENGVEFERGMIPDVGTALDVARVWLAGGGYDELPKARRFIL